MWNVGSLFLANLASAPKKRVALLREPEQKKSRFSLQDKSRSRGDDESIWNRTFAMATFHRCGRCSIRRLENDERYVGAPGPCGQSRIDQSQIKVAPAILRSSKTDAQGSAPDCPARRYIPISSPRASRGRRVRLFEPSISILCVRPRAQAQRI
jgi:hypothetical protein